MEPITAAIGAIGLGANLFFGQRAKEDANYINADEQRKFGLQKDVNAQRQTAMELSGRRQQMEDFRNMQRARAQGIQNATTQGANKGSGLQGGIADVENQGFFASAGVNQNLQIGRNIFSIDNNITDLNADESNRKADQATNQQWASLGGSVMQNAGTIGKVAQYGFGQGANAYQNLSWLSQGPTGFLRG